MTDSEPPKTGTLPLQSTPQNFHSWRIKGFPLFGEGIFFKHNQTDNVDLISISVSNIFRLDYIKILPELALSPSYWGGRRIISEFLRDPVIGKKRYLGGRFSEGR